MAAWGKSCGRWIVKKMKRKKKKIENTETQFDSKNKKVVEIKSLKITPARNKWQGIKFRFGFGFERRKWFHEPGPTSWGESEIRCFFDLTEGWAWATSKSYNKICKLQNYKIYKNKEKKTIFKTRKSIHRKHKNTQRDKIIKLWITINKKKTNYLQ